MYVFKAPIPTACPNAVAFNLKLYAFWAIYFSLRGDIVKIRKSFKLSKEKLLAQQGREKLTIEDTILENTVTVYVYKQLHARTTVKMF